MVNITKFAVRRPITIVLCLITIAYFGVQSLLGTKLELTPEMEMPMLVIATVYAGASPEDVNDLITVKQEDAISALDGVDTVQSYSQENVAVVTYQMSLNTVAGAVSFPNQVTFIRNEEGYYHMSWNDRVIF